MFILTDENNVILYISETLDRQEVTDYYLINNGNLAIPNQFIKDTFEVEEIPEGVIARKYCYTKRKGFFENENYIEPVREMTNKEIQEKLADLQTQINELKSK